MTFFYNLNKKLDAIRNLPSTTHGQLNERDMSRAAIGTQGVAEGSTTRGGFSGSAGQAQHEIGWLKNKIETLKPLLAKKPSVARQIKDLERQIRERELAIAYQKQGVAEGYDDPYDQGFSDGYNGNRKRNPFPLRSKEAEEYDEGWFEGLGEYEKMNPDLDEGVAEGSKEDMSKEVKAMATGTCPHCHGPVKKKEHPTLTQYHCPKCGIRASQEKQGMAEGSAADDSVNYTLDHPVDKEYVYTIIRNGKSAGTYHSLDQAQRIVGNMKKSAHPKLDKFKITRKPRAKMAGPVGVLPEQGVAEGSEDLASLRAKAKEISDKIDTIVKDGGRVGFNDPLSRQLKAIRAKIQQAKKKGVAKDFGGGKGRNAEMDEEASQGNAFTAHKRPKVEKPAVGTITHGRKHDVEEIPGGRRVTRRTDPSGISVGADDEAAQSGEKRGRGRPKKAGGPAQERVTANSRKADRTRFQSKKKTNEAVSEDDIEVLERLMHEAFDEGNNALGNALQAALERIQGVQDEDQYDDDEQVNEKAVSKKQQRFMGMVHATQKGEKAPSKEVAKTAKTMKKGDAEDFASTKHKGLPEKKKPEDKKEKTEETADSNPSKGGVKYGGGIYDSMNRDLENMIAESMARLNESMSINMSMNNNEHGGPSKSLTVTATDEDAMKLSQLLKSAGLGGGDEEGYGGSGYKSACGCGTPDCSCGDQQMDEVSMNQPDYPTETETSSDAMQYAGGLNKPKSTGQTTTPVIASQHDRQHSYAEAEEDALHRMMEMAGIAEAKGKKPNFLDVDKDGDKKEPFKTAVDDKKEEKVQESIFDLANQWRAYKG
jgi:hypothetical protein